MINIRRGMKQFLVLTFCVSGAIAGLPALSHGQAPAIQDKAD